MAVDYELWTRLVPRVRFANAPEVVLKYRRHGGQTTKKERIRFINDLRKIRFRYFYSLFPETPWRDFVAFYRAADRRPLASIEEVERAGKLFLELFGRQAADLRAIMAHRWRETQAKSPILGPEGESVFRQFLDALENEKIRP